MSLPTPRLVMNFYLYGQSSPDISAPPRPFNSTSKLHVDMQEYIDGPGRFGDPARFKIVQDFFNAPPGTFIYGRQYTFSEVKAALETLHPEKKYTDLWDTQQYKWIDPSSITSTELFERTFIYNSVQFKLGPDTKFTLDSTGKPSLQNWSVLPDPDFQENFDFESTDRTADLLNHVFRYLMDPEGIGRKVEIVFDNPITPNSIPYTRADFDRDSTGFVEGTFNDFMNAIKDLGDDYGWAWNNRGALFGPLLPGWVSQVTGPYGNAERAASPLVIDVDGDGIELSGKDGPGAVYWDLDQDGFREASGWIAGGDGLLALDRNGNGAIDAQGELLGRWTRTGSRSCARSTPTPTAKSRLRIRI